MKRKAEHHRGSYQVRAKRIVDTANRDTTTRCWRCGLLLTEHPPHRNGKPPFWTAGHVHDGQVDGTLQPEASVCNFRAGAVLKNARNYDLQPTRRR